MDRRKLGRHAAFRPLFQDAEVGPEQPEGYRAVRLQTGRGAGACRYYPAAQGPIGRAAVWVGGVGGGWDTPVAGLYPRLCGELARHEGIASLRVSFRHPTVLEEAVLDVRAGLCCLEGEGVGDAAVVIGHSFGGEVEQAVRGWLAARHAARDPRARRRGQGCDHVIVSGARRGDGRYDVGVGETRLFCKSPLRIRAEACCPSGAVALDGE